MPEISIHAPHAGCDLGFVLELITVQDFNPRTPCGVRLLSSYRSRRYRHFNPRTPCGVRLDDDWDIPF